MTGIDLAYAACEEITRREARNFSYGIRLLPPVKRRALAAVYALARRIDDIGDGTLPAGEKLVRLAQTGAALHRLTAPAPAATPGGRDTTIADGPDTAVAGGPDRDPPGGPDPVMVALADAADRLPIPLGAFDELIEGCVADVTGRRYESFDQLVWYCRCVAGSVGRLCLGVFGSTDPQAARYADALGVALQLTNILRDLVEDRVNGRVYLPASDLERFGCSLVLDTTGGGFVDPPDRLAELVRFEATRAEDWYGVGLRLLPLLDRRSAACTAAMAGIYHRLLHRIVADPLAVTRTRLSLPPGEKAWVAARALVGRSA